MNNKIICSLFVVYFFGSVSPLFCMHHKKFVPIREISNPFELGLDQKDLLPKNSCALQPPCISRASKKSNIFFDENDVNQYFLVERASKVPDPENSLVGQNSDTFFDESNDVAHYIREEFFGGEVLEPKKSITLGSKNVVAHQIPSNEHLLPKKKPVEKPKYSGPKEKKKRPTKLLASLPNTPTYEGAITFDTKTVTSPQKSPTKLKFPVLAKSEFLDEIEQPTTSNGSIIADNDLEHGPDSCVVIQQESERPVHVEQDLQTTSAKVVDQGTLNKEAQRIVGQLLLTKKLLSPKDCSALERVEEKLKHTRHAKKQLAITPQDVERLKKLLEISKLSIASHVEKTLQAVQDFSMLTIATVDDVKPELLSQLGNINTNLEELTPGMQLFEQESNVVSDFAQIQAQATIVKKKIFDATHNVYQQKIENFTPTYLKAKLSLEDEDSDEVVPFVVCTDSKNKDELERLKGIFSSLNATRMLALESNCDIDKILNILNGIVGDMPKFQQQITSRSTRYVMKDYSELTEDSLKASVYEMETLLKFAAKHDTTKLFNNFAPKATTFLQLCGQYIITKNIHDLTRQAMKHDESYDYVPQEFMPKVTYQQKQLATFYGAKLYDKNWSMRKFKDRLDDISDGYDGLTKSITLRDVALYELIMPKEKKRLDALKAHGPKVVDILAKTKQSKWIKDVDESGLAANETRYILTTVLDENHRILSKLK